MRTALAAITMALTLLAATSAGAIEITVGDSNEPAEAHALYVIDERFCSRWKACEAKADLPTTDLMARTGKYRPAAAFSPARCNAIAPNPSRLNQACRTVANHPTTQECLRELFAARSDDTSVLTLQYLRNGEPLRVKLDNAECEL